MTSFGICFSSNHIVFTVKSSIFLCFQSPFTPTSRRQPFLEARLLRFYGGLISIVHYFSASSAASAEMPSLVGHDFHHPRTALVLLRLRPCAAPEVRQRLNRIHGIELRICTKKPLNLRLCLDAIIPPLCTYFSFFSFFFSNCSSSLAGSCFTFSFFSRLLLLLLLPTPALPGRKW